MLRSAARTLLALSLAALAACAADAPSAGPIAIVATPPAGGPAMTIRVDGLSGAELDALDGVEWPLDVWQTLFHVSVAETEDIPVVGRYVVADRSLEFRPQFPFDAGRVYAVRFDPARLPVPRTDAAVTTRISVAAPARSPSTFVTAIFPSAGVWPENMLRFYIHFSAPMSRLNGVRFVHLVDADGREVPDAILAAYADLWNADGTRLTVFFDPGRVKRGVGPNLKLGRAIVAGRRYAVTVDKEWPDANGQPLTSAFRQEFTAGPTAEEGLALDDWRITPPAAGALDPVDVAFPAPLDHALLQRALGVRTLSGVEVPGTTTTRDHETAWRFTPAAPWRAGDYELVVLTLLEDPAGNKVGQPFEVLPDTPVPETTAEIATRRFEVR